MDLDLSTGVSNSISAVDDLVLAANMATGVSAVTIRSPFVGLVLVEGIADLSAIERGRGDWEGGGWYREPKAM
jgi:hypothetical protein